MAHLKLEDRLEIQEQMHQLENLSHLFILSLMKLPGDMEPYIVDDQIAFKNVLLEEKVNLADKPAFMIFCDQGQKIFKDQSNQFVSVALRMQECLITVMQRGMENLLQQFESNSCSSIFKKIDKLAESVKIPQDSKSTPTQLMFIKRLHSQFTQIAKRMESIYILYIGKKIILAWLSYFIIVKTEFSNDDNNQLLDQDTLLNCCKIFQDILKHSNMFCEQVWEDQLSYYQTGMVQLLKYVKNDYQVIPCLTSLIGCSIHKCNFHQIIQLSNIQNAMQFLGERENSSEIWRVHILNQLLRLCLGKLRPSYCQSNVSEVMGKRQNNSMDYYNNQQQQYSKVNNQETTLSDIDNVRVVIKFIMRIIQQDPLQYDALERNLQLSDFNEKQSWVLLIIIMKSIQECSQFIYLLFQNLKRDAKILDIVEQLLIIAKYLLIMVNSLLGCHSTQKVACYTIGLFGQINITDNSQINTSSRIQKQYWHPILEIYDISRRIEISKLPGTNQNIEKHIYSINIEIMKTFQLTLTTLDYPLDQFPLEAKQFNAGYSVNRSEFDLDTKISILRSQFGVFMSSIQYSKSGVDQGDFSRTFEKVLNMLIARNQGVQCSFFKNLVEIFFQMVPNSEEYLLKESELGYRLLCLMQENLCHLLSRFRCRSESVLMKLLADNFNCCNERLLLKLIICPLDVQLEPWFFEDCDQMQVGHTSVNPIGLKNIHYKSLKRCRSGQEYMMETLEAIGILFELCNDEGQHQLNLVMLFKSTFNSGDIYIYDKMIENNKCQLNLVHGILCVLNMEMEVEKEVQIICQCEEDAFYDEIYQREMISYPDERYLGSILFCPLSKDKCRKSSIFSCGMRALMKMIELLTRSNKMNRMEELICSVKMQQNNDQLMIVCYRHLISQFLSMMIRKIYYKYELNDVMIIILLQQILQVMEFLILSVETNQSFMQLVIKPRKSNETLPMQMLLHGLGQNIHGQDQNGPKCRLQMLTMIFLHQLLVSRENKLIHFNELCRSKEAKFIIDILNDCLSTFQQPFPHLLYLTSNNSLSLSEAIDNIMTCNNKSSTPFQQLVVDNIFTISIHQTATMHYFLQIILNQIKQDNTQTNCSSIIKDFFAKGVFQNWLTFLIQLNDINLQASHNNTLNNFTSINKNPPLNNILSFLAITHLGFGRDYIIDSSALFNTLYNQHIQPLAIINSVAQIQRYNLLEGFKQASQKTFYSLSSLMIMVQSCGTNGIPLSCHSTNNNLFIQCYNQEYLSKVCKIFYHNDEELHKLTTDLAKEMIIPNHKKQLIHGGLIALFSGESSYNQSQSIEKTFQNLVYLLEQCTKELCYILESSTTTEQIDQMDQLIPPLQINLSFLQSLILLLDFNQQSTTTSTTTISNFNHNPLLITFEQINIIADHQIQFFIILTTIKHYFNHSSQGQYIFLILQLLNSLMTFIDKSLSKINHPIQLFIDSQTDNCGNILTIFHNVVQLISQSPNDNNIYLLASILLSAVKIYPQSVSELIISETYNSQLDVTRMFINIIKKPQTHFLIFTSIISAWNSMVNVLGRELTDYLIIKRQIFVQLINQPDLLNINNEKIYIECKPEVKICEYNYKHIMWCYTLAFVRDIIANSGVEGLKYFIHFFDAFKQRMFSSLIYFDNSIPLQHFTKIIQLNISELQRQNFQPGLLGLIELQQIILLMNQMLFTQNLKNNYPQIIDQVIYTFSNIIFAQLGAFKRIKSVLNLIKPFTFLDEKLKQLRADVPGKDIQSLQMTPRRSPNSQNEQTIYSENKTDLYFYSKPQIKQRMEIEVTDFTAFQLSAVLDYLNVCQVGIIGLVQSLEFRDLPDRFEQSYGKQPFKLEKNYWSDLSEQIARFVYCNIDIYINIKNYNHLESLLQFVNLSTASFDHQVTNGGVQQLFGYPTTRSELLYICLYNIINGIYAALLHLQLRDMFRQASLMRENSEMEINLSRTIIQLIDLMEQETLASGAPQDVNEETLNEIYSHDIHESTNSYWHDWKDKFDAYLK